MKTINEQVFDKLKSIGKPVTSTVFMELAPDLADSKEQASTRLNDLYCSGRAKRRRATQEDKSVVSVDRARWVFFVTAAKYSTKAKTLVKRDRVRTTKRARGEVMINRLLKRADNMQKEMNSMLDCIAMLAADYNEMSELVAKITEFRKK